MVLSDFKLCLSYIANQPHVLPRLPGTLMALMVAVKRVQLLRKAHRTAHESDYKSPVCDSKTAQCISSTEVKVSQGLLRWPSGKEPTCIQETPETSPGFLPCFTMSFSRLSPSISKGLHGSLTLAASRSPWCTAVFVFVFFYFHDTPIPCRFSGCLFNGAETSGPSQDRPLPLSSICLLSVKNL